MGECGITGPDAVMPPPSYAPQVGFAATYGWSLILGSVYGVCIPLSCMYPARDLVWPRRILRVCVPPPSGPPHRRPPLVYRVSTVAIYAYFPNRITPIPHNPAAPKTDGSQKSFSALGGPSVPTLTPGAMAWPKWHSAEPSHRVRIAHHRARHERAHLPSPLQSHGSSATALRSHVNCLAHRPLHWKARPILTLCPCVCVSR